MGASEIIALIAALINAARELTANISSLADLFDKMREDGRLTLTPEEEAKLVAARDQARAMLQSTIDAAP